MESMTTDEKVKAHVQLVRELSSELAAYLYTLPDDVWRYAEQYGSPCEHWKVADVVTHLISGASTYSLSLSRAIKDETSPPMGYRQRSAEEVLESLVSLRISYYDDLFPEFNASCRRINTLLIDLKPDDYEKSVWHPLTVIPISRLIDYRILELAVHGWGCRYASDFGRVYVFVEPIKGDQRRNIAADGLSPEKRGRSSGKPRFIKNFVLRRFVPGV